MTMTDQPRSRDLAIIEAVAGGLSTRQTAEHVGCSTATVTRTRRRYRDRINALSDERWEALAAHAGRAVPKALSTLLELMDSPVDAVRLGASKAVIDAAIRLREAHDLTQRITVLEAEPEVTRWAV